ITHFGARPAATRSMLSKPFLNLAVQFSHVGPAECGVSVTLGRVNSGWFGEGGSSTITSSPAAAICRSFSALYSALSSMTGPRHVLMITALFFIMASSRAADRKSAVEGRELE